MLRAHGRREMKNRGTPPRREEVKQSPRMPLEVHDAQRLTQAFELVGEILPCQPLSTARPHHANTVRPFEELQFARYHLSGLPSTKTIFAHLLIKTSERRLRRCRAHDGTPL